MAKIEKRCKFKVALKKDMRPGMRDMLEFGIGWKIPVPWYDKNKGEIIRKLPIVEIDISDASKPVFVLDASTKYNSRLVRHSFDYILECCFDYIEDIPKLSDYKFLIDDIKVDEYVAITSDNYEYLVDEIVKVTTRHMCSQSGRICEINDKSNTFTIDTSEDAYSSSWIYSIDDVLLIKSAPE